MRLLQIAGAGARRSYPIRTHRIRLQALLWPAAIALVVLAGFGLGAGLALRGQAGDEPAPAALLGPLLERAGPLVVYSEFGAEVDSLWAANPGDPGDRVLLGLALHAPGYGIAASLSPEGAHLAYTVLPPGAARAELWLLETESGEARRLAEGVDLIATPVWSAAGDATVVRRSSGGEDGGSAELLRVDLSGGATTLAEAGGGLYAIDFSPDGGWLYYASLSSAGTELSRVASAGGAPQTIAHLSDGLARDWQLSPDGTRLAYLAQAEGAALAAHVLDLSTGRVTAPFAAAGAQFRPTWEHDGSLTIGVLGEGGRAGALSLQLGDGEAAAVESLPGTTGDIDVPLSWSPDGEHLVVRAFEGSTTADPGPSRVVVLDPAGERRPLSPLSDVAVAGWLVSPG